MHHIFLSWSSVDGHLDYFHVLTIVNSAAIDIDRASSVPQMVKNQPAMQEIQAWLLGGEDPLEKVMQTTPVSGLENCMDRGAWWARVHGVAKSWTWLRNFHSLTYKHWGACIFLKQSFHFFLDINPKLRLLDHMVSLFLVFQGSSIQFSIVAIPIYIPTQDRRAPFSPHPHQHLLFIGFLMITILTGVRLHLIVIWIWFFLINSNAEHLFMCPLPSVCLLWRNVYLDLPIFMIRLFLLIFSCIWEKGKDVHYCHFYSKLYMRA